MPLWIEWTQISYARICPPNDLLSHANLNDFLFDGHKAGIRHLHNLGLVHNDLTPWKSIFEHDEKVVILMSRTHGLSLTLTHAILGNTMSPN